jgi:hypothetical protein
MNGATPPDAPPAESSQHSTTCEPVTTTAARHTTVALGIAMRCITRALDVSYIHTSPLTHTSDTSPARSSTTVSTGDIMAPRSTRVGRTCTAGSAALPLTPRTRYVTATPVDSPTMTASSSSDTHVGVPLMATVRLPVTAHARVSNAANCGQSSAAPCSRR